LFPKDTISNIRYLSFLKIRLRGFCISSEAAPFFPSFKVCTGCHLYLNRVNPFYYLTTLQKHSSELFKDPKRWLLELPANIGDSGLTPSGLIEILFADHLLYGPGPTSSQAHGRTPKDRGYQA